MNASKQIDSVEQEPQQEITPLDFAVDEKPEQQHENLDLKEVKEENSHKKTKKRKVRSNTLNENEEIPVDSNVEDTNQDLVVSKKLKLKEEIKKN